MNENLTISDPGMGDSTCNEDDKVTKMDIEPHENQCLEIKEQQKEAHWITLDEIANKRSQSIEEINSHLNGNHSENDSSEGESLKCCRCAYETALNSCKICSP